MTQRSSATNLLRIRTNAARVLRNRIVVIDLYFDTALGRKFRDNDRVRNFAEKSCIGITPQAVVKCMQICGSNDILEMDRLKRKCRQSIVREHL